MSARDNGRAGATARDPRTRMRAFRVIAWIMTVVAVAGGVFTAGTGIAVEEMRIHAFHNVVVASLLLVLSAPAAFQAARDPDHPLPGLVQLAAVGVAALVTMALALTIDPFTLLYVVLGGVLWVLWLRRPSRDPFPQERPNAVLLVMALLSAVPLAIYAFDNAELQRIDTSEHAEFLHWVETSFYAVAVPLVGLAAAWRPATFRLSAWCAGIALAILGGASLALSDYASALRSPWGAIALVGGIAFVVVAEVAPTWSAPARSAPARMS